MLKKKAATLLIIGLILVTGSSVMAQGLQEKTIIAGESLAAATSHVLEFAIDPGWMQDPTLYCMNLDRTRPWVSPKRLVLDKSIQELKWAAEHGPRRELLADFLSRQSGSEPLAGDGQMARVGGTVASWPEILAGQKKNGPSPVRVGSLSVGLIGPDHAGQ